MLRLRVFNRVMLFLQSDRTTQGSKCFLSFCFSKGNLSIFHLDKTLFVPFTKKAINSFDLKSFFAGLF
jgi:hypothetical protein